MEEQALAELDEGEFIAESFDTLYLSYLNEHF
jgi:hypothetical protein